MNTLHLLLGLPWVQALGLTLLHFLWQGALIGLAASVLFRIASRSSARVRYLLACFLLGLCVAAPLLTFAILTQPPLSDSPRQTDPLALAENAGAARTSISSSNATSVSRPESKSFPTVRLDQVAANPRDNYFASAAPFVRAAKTLVRWIVPLWLTGVLVMGLRLGAAWSRIQIWRFTAVPVIDTALLDLFSGLSEEMNLAKKVRLLLSDKITVPLTLGWLKPVILVPAQILTGLSAEELKAVLAHELAHIARYDYLVNLFQSVIEIVLFYHPAVWWISGKIREAREECCDEAALRMGADRVAYARALADLAESCLAPRPALGATGGSLLHRIARLLGKPRPEPAWNRSHAAWALSMAGAFLLVLAIFYSSKTIADPVSGKPPLPVVKNAATPGVPADAPARALRTAAQKGDVAEIRRLLGTSLDLKTNPLLHDLVQDAALGENFEILQLLLDHGMDINGRNERGETALFGTIGNGQENVSRFLIEHGIDVNQADHDGTPPAWWAANLDFSRSNIGPATGSLATLELLRQKGARFSGRNKNGATIFTYMMHVLPPDARLSDEKMPAMAEQQKDFEAERRTIQIILAGGADPNGLDTWLNETPLIDALESSHHAAAQALLDAGVDVNKPDNKGNPPIVFSVLKGWGEPVPIAIVKQMLARGADPNSRTQGENLLDSLPKESTSVLELLLEQRGYGPIDEASDKNLNEAVQLLLTHGARFTGSLSPAVDRLLRAAAAGDLPGLQQAVAQGASVSAADADGWTPLMVALSLGHEDGVEWLLANGADVKTKNAQGYSPLFFAVLRQQAQRVDEFLAKGSDPNCGGHADFIGRSTTIGSALWRTVVQTNLPIFKSLIAAGAKATPDEVGMAIQLGQVEMVRILLDKGSPPDYPKPNENRNSVYWAVDYNHPEILKLLLDHGADPELKTDYNETPLSIAKQWHKDLVPMLEEAIKRWAQGHASATAADNNASKAVSTIQTQGAPSTNQPVLMTVAASSQSNSIPTASPVTAAPKTAFEQPVTMKETKSANNFIRRVYYQGGNLILEQYLNASPGSIGQLIFYNHTVVVDDRVGRRPISFSSRTVVPNNFKIQVQSIAADSISPESLRILDLSQQIISEFFIDKTGAMRPITKAEHDANIVLRTEKLTPLLDKMDRNSSATGKQSSASDDDTFIARPNNASAQAMVRKLKSLIIADVNFNKVDVATALQFFAQKSKELDPDKKGINFALGDLSRITSADPIHREVTIALQNVPLDDLLSYVVQQTNLKCSIENDTVYFKP
jgi:ankyrin repeat protein/beta-lactamase regulating signal transducer with metallopeptidase domain